MQNIILRTKNKSMQLQASKVDEWWNLIQDLLYKNIQGLFNEHKVDEVNYQRNLKRY
jgi:hypothetical protein